MEHLKFKQDQIDHEILILLQNRGPLYLREIYFELKLDPATCRRHLMDLVAQGMLRSARGINKLMFWTPEAEENLPVRAGPEIGPARTGAPGKRSG